MTALSAGLPSPLLGPVAQFRHPALVAGGCAVGAGVLAGAGLAYGPAAAAATIVVALVGLLVLQRPLAGAYLLVGVVPIVSGLRRDLPLPGLRLSEVVITGLAALLLLGVQTARARPWTLFDWLALAYAAGTLLLGGFDLIERGAPLTATSVGTLVGPFQFLLLYRAVLAVVRTDAERRRALALLLLASVPVSLLALAQYLQVGGVAGVLESATGSQQLAAHAAREDIGSRMTGVFPHWQMLAGYLFVIVVICTAALLARQRVLMPRGALAAIAAARAGGDGRDGHVRDGDRDRGRRADPGRLVRAHRARRGRPRRRRRWRALFDVRAADRRSASATRS